MFGMFVPPRQEFPKGRAPVAIVRFFCGSEFCKRFIDRREVKHRIVAKTVRTAKMIEDSAFCFAFKYGDRLPVPRCSNDADEASRTPGWRNVFHLPKHPGVVQIIIRVGVGEVRLVGGIACGVHTGGAIERVNFKAGLVGEHNLSGRVDAVLLGFFPGIGFKRLTVLDRSGQGRKVWKRCDFDSVMAGSSGEVPDLTGVGCSDQHSLHDFDVVAPLCFHQPRPIRRAMSSEAMKPALLSQVRAKVI